MGWLYFFVQISDWFDVIGFSIYENYLKSWVIQLVICTNVLKSQVIEKHGICYKIISENDLELFDLLLIDISKNKIISAKSATTHW